VGKDTTKTGEKKCTPATDTRLGGKRTPTRKEKTDLHSAHEVIRGVQKTKIAEGDLCASGGQKQKEERGLNKTGPVKRQFAVGNRSGERPRSGKKPGQTGGPRCRDQTQQRRGKIEKEEAGNNALGGRETQKKSVKVLVAGKKEESQRQSSKRIRLGGPKKGGER